VQKFVELTGREPGCLGPGCGSPQRGPHPRRHRCTRPGPHLEPTVARPPRGLLGGRRAWPQQGLPLGLRGCVRASCGVNASSPVNVPLVHNATCFGSWPGSPVTAPNLGGI